MKSVQKATIGIMLTSVALIFSIIGLLMTGGSLAWFGENKNVNADGFNVKIATLNNITATLKSYPVSKIDGDTI